MIDEILYFMDESNFKIVVPEKTIITLLEFHHDLPLAGHRDFEKTFEGLKNRYFWFEMHKSVKEYCASCHLCQTKKSLGKQLRAPLKPIFVSEPWSLIGIDFAGP